MYPVRRTYVSVVHLVHKVHCQPAAEVGQRCPKRVWLRKQRMHISAVLIAHAAAVICRQVRAEACREPRNVYADVLRVQ